LSLLSVKANRSSSSQVFLPCPTPPMLVLMNNPIRLCLLEWVTAALETGKYGSETFWGKSTCWILPALPSVSSSGTHRRSAELPKCWTSFEKEYVSMWDGCVWKKLIGYHNDSARYVSEVVFVFIESKLWKESKTRKSKV